MFLYFSNNEIFYVISYWISTALTCSSIFHVVLIYSVFLHGLIHIIFCLEYLYLCLCKPCPIHCLFSNVLLRLYGQCHGDLTKESEKKTFSPHKDNLGNLAVFLIFNCSKYFIIADLEFCL